MATVARFTGTVRKSDDFHKALSNFSGLLTDLFPKSSVQNPTLNGLSIGDIKSSLSAPLTEFSGTKRVSKSSLQHAASLFLARKILPSPEGSKGPASVKRYMAKLSTTPELNPDFARTVLREIPHLFKEGWDKDYAHYVRRVVISQNACTSLPRKRHGARRQITDLEKISQEEFHSWCLGENTPVLPTKRSIVQLDDGGKVRTVTIQSALNHILLPLHLMIYDHLGRKPWLVRGDPKAKELLKKGFSQKTGELFISGDYESATDNFNARHSQLILSALLEGAPNVPDAVKREAVSSLTGQLEYESKRDRTSITSEQTNGQLMGNFLSFPLLCLTNYLGVVHALGPRRVRHLPLLINGDDIIFRSTREEYEKWAASVRESGLVLSRGKTLVHPSILSINSTFFTTTPTSVHLVPVVRAATILPRVDSEPSFHGRLAECAKGFQNRQKRAIQEFFLREHSGAARKTHGSLRVNGHRIHYTVLGKVGLFPREVRLFETRRVEGKNTKIDAPAPSPSPDVTKGWVFLPIKSLALPRIAGALFPRHCIESTWDPTFLPPDPYLHPEKSPPSGGEKSPASCYFSAFLDEQRLRKKFYFKYGFTCKFFKKEFDRLVVRHRKTWLDGTPPPPPVRKAAVPIDSLELFSRPSHPVFRRQKG